MRKLFVDCSHVCRNIYLNTGIQRVVRSFMKEAEFLEKKFEIKIIPVDLSNGAFCLMNIQSLFELGDTSIKAAEPKQDIRQIIRSYFLNVYCSGRGFINAICGNHPVAHKFLFAQRDSFGLSFLIDRCILSPIRFFSKVRIFISPLLSKARTIIRPHQGHDPFSVIEKNDILLLLDATWDSNIWPSVRRFKDNGNKVVAAVYDLIPITHPEFCDSQLVVVFKEWFMNSVSQVDGYIAISKTVRDNLKKFIRDYLKCQVEDKKFDYFYLGWDFSPLPSGGETIRDEVKYHFQKRPTYIIVSTIEPRKNHGYLLDAFENLWEKKLDVNLVFIGRIGWKVENLLERIRNHKEFHKRLFHWHDINDIELGYCYNHARALLFPSVIEGFGLPIIESLRNRLPVIASKTPIHKEIGGNRIGYCNISDPEDLADMIEKIEMSGFGEVPVVSDTFQWMTWSESAEMLYGKIIKMI